MMVVLWCGDFRELISEGRGCLSESGTHAKIRVISRKNKICTRQNYTNNKIINGPRENNETFSD